jgi:hypothetical protein
VKGIVIYIEGGGDSTDGKAQLRRGFDALLTPQKGKARTKNLHWNIVTCGGRNATADAFLWRSKTSTDEVVVLLVDSEEQVADQTPAGRISHLRRRDPKWSLSDDQAEKVHLMTQCMEAWIVADPEALAAYYGKQFQISSLPKRTCLDDEPKDALYTALDAATRHTQKGSYAKIKHAGHLLQKIDASKISKRCTSFRQFVTWLDQAIANS